MPIRRYRLHNIFHKNPMKIIMEIVRTPPFCHVNCCLTTMDTKFDASSVGCDVHVVSICLLTSLIWPTETPETTEYTQWVEL